MHDTLLGARAEKILRILRPPKMGDRAVWSCSLSLWRWKDIIRGSWCRVELPSARDLQSIGSPDDEPILNGAENQVSTWTEGHKVLAARCHWIDFSKVHRREMNASGEFQTRSQEHLMMSAHGCPDNDILSCLPCPSIGTKSIALS